MKIIIATPIYPPEIAEPAQYVKKLASRWSDKHEVVIITYANAVEKIPNVKIVAINKHWPLLLRFIKYTFNLLKMAQGADIIYAQNAVAVGLPAIIVKTLLNIPVVIRFAEDEAWKRSIQLGLTTKSMNGF